MLQGAVSVAEEEAKVTRQELLSVIEAEIKTRSVALSPRTQDMVAKSVGPTKGARRRVSCKQSRGSCLVSLGNIPTQ